MEPEEAFNGSPAAGARGGSVVAIIGAEDEDFENDIEPNPDDQNSMFQSLELVRQHPAYLMAFLQHVVLQFDSCPVLCYLHVDMLRKMNPKEGKKQFLEFCHLFLDKAGLLRVPVPHQVQFELDRTRPELLADDVQRRYLQEIQAFQEPEISRQLEDFRSKRLMGMTPGEQELTELESYQTRDVGIREAKEKQLAEVLLARLEEMHLTISSDEEKSSAIFGAIVTYMKYLGVKTKLSDSKKSKSNFFRKKISGIKKPEELQAKSRKGFSLPGAALWNRDTHNSDFRQSKVPEGEADKATHPDRKGPRASDKIDSGAARPKAGAAGTPASDPPSVAVTINPPPGEGAEGDAGLDPPGPTELGDTPPRGFCPTEPPSSEQHPTEDGAESERKRIRLVIPQPHLACLGGATVPGDINLATPTSSAKYRDPPPPPGGCAPGASVGRGTPPPASAACLTWPPLTPLAPPGALRPPGLPPGSLGCCMARRPPPNQVHAPQAISRCLSLSPPCMWSCPLPPRTL